MAETIGRTTAPEGMAILTRTAGAGGAESTYEKVVVLPSRDDRDPAHHAWADARFAADILAEHALFFALLMPEELAAKERAEALQFQKSFSALYERIVADKPPERSEGEGVHGAAERGYQAVHRVQGAPRRGAGVGPAAQPRVASLLRSHTARGRTLDPPPANVGSRRIGIR